MHNYYTTVVSINATDKEIVKELASTCEGEYNHEAEEFMSNIIKNMDVVKVKGTHTRKEAEELLNKNDDFYWGHYVKAVPFATGMNSKIKTLKRRIEETVEKKTKYISEHRVGDFKSAFIGCPSCQSKINKDYFVKTKNSKRLDSCPVCGELIMSETMKKTLKGYDDKIAMLDKELESEIKKSISKPTNYLVIAGIHS